MVGMRGCGNLRDQESLYKDTNFLSLLRGLVGWFGLSATLSLIGRTGPTLGYPLTWSCYFRTVLWPDGSLLAPETVPSGAWWGLAVLWIKFRASCMISMCSVTWTISPISREDILTLGYCTYTLVCGPHGTFPSFDWGICIHAWGRLHASLRHTTVCVTVMVIVVTWFSHLHVRGHSSWLWVVLTHHFNWTAF